MAETGSPFHRGERAIQERLGVRDRIEKQGRRMIRDHMTEEHQAFFAQLPLLIAGSVDAHGRPWASALVGEQCAQECAEHFTREFGIPGTWVSE